MGTIDPSIGERIRSARHAAGFHNRSQFARDLHIAPATLYRYETGRIAVGLESMMAIAKACNVTVEWLFDGDKSSSNGNESCNVS